MTKRTEEELALILIAWLKANGWEVYEEVKFWPDPGDRTAWYVADIVATRNGVVAIFEVKLAFGLTVMRQAERWVRYAHEVYVFVPGKGVPANVDHAYGHGKLREVGIGVLHLRDHSKLEVQMAARPGGELPPMEKLVITAQAAVTSRPEDARLEGELRDEHKSGRFARAGVKGGDRVSPANLTKAAIAAHVASAGGAAPIAEVARAVGASSWLITKWAKAQGIKGIAHDSSASEIVLRAVNPGNERPITATSHKLHPSRYIPE